MTFPWELGDRTIDFVLETEGRRGAAARGWLGEGEHRRELARQEREFEEWEREWLREEEERA